MAFDPDEDAAGEWDDEWDGDRSYVPIRRSRTVRWTAILITASFALAGLSSLSRWW